MNIFFTSDTHYYHKNVIKYCNRPFLGTHEMSEALIENHNNTVSKNDIIYFLGDFCFCGKNQAMRILDRLNGKKYFIKGNHDKIMKKEDVKEYFEFVVNYHELTIKDDFNKRSLPIILMHYPIRSWNRKSHGSFHLYGHTHGSLIEDVNENRFDVGVDATAKRFSENGVLNPNDYRPISYDEVKDIFNNKRFLL